MAYGGRTERSVTTLYVNGFGPEVRARDLAYEFERFGRLVRCDIPTPKNPQARPYAFIEYEDRRDAADAYDQMHKKLIGPDPISVEYAKNTNVNNRRYDGDARGPPPRRHDDNRRYDDRGPPPRRYDDRGPPRNYAGSNSSRDHEDRRAPRGRSASPNRGSRSGGSVAARSPIPEKPVEREPSPVVAPAEKQEATPPPELQTEETEVNRLDD